METQATGQATTPESTRLRRARDAGLWLREGGLGLLGIAIALGCAGSGWYDSFIGLHQFAMDHMGLSSRDAWFVPTTFDGGALGLMLVVARAAMHGRGAIVWRLGVFALTGLSSWINWQHISDKHGQPIAALLPVVSAAVFEGLMDEARKAHERRSGDVRPRLSLLRWCFDFSGTKAILKAYVLGQPLPEGFAEAADSVAEEKAQLETATQPRRKTAPAAKATVERAVVAAKPAPMAALEAPKTEAKPAEGAKVIEIAETVPMGIQGRDLYFERVDHAIATGGEIPSIDGIEVEIRKAHGLPPRRSGAVSKAVRDAVREQGYQSHTDYVEARRASFPVDQRREVTG